MSLPLDGRRVVVTGAASGLGAAAVRALTAAGAQIVATYHQTMPADQAQATWLPCDARDPAAVDAMIDAAVAAMGGLDVLVNAAGSWQQGVPGTITAADIDAALNTNVKTTILTNQAAYAAMRRTGGRIINFGSAEAVMGSPISAVYAAAKGAVAAWTRSAAKAWAADRVTVNALAPAMQTRGADRLREFLGPDAAPFIDQQIKATIPLGGALGDPDRDLGPVLVFLAGEGSHFITGQLIAVDGGLIMLGG
ncbi:SDR family NAD(P)-dependent oxidoreductase [Mycobacterium sp. shizuoka-1]|uniref:SDR family NAD(P)-dependent oxidoreductase n=1 Tax=Mycobacterium sp. shizuoka-1 TaxID=2039281 RepID=UPI000C05E4D0|nr:SDR family oxidoreductase [Mycobacterium sp. shizuoka-1]GAY13940.1 short-chain dehydrogenase [Mycobacterium sp. shizuoka-1]